MALTAKKVYAILNGKIKKISGDVSGIATPLIFKGSVATADLLPASPETGWMYNIESKSIYGEPGTNVAWTGTTWDSLGTTIDLSLYMTADQVNEELDKKVDKVDGKGLSSVDVTSEMVNKWNAKSDFSGSYEDLTDKPTTISEEQAKQIVENTEASAKKAKESEDKAKEYMEEILRLSLSYVLKSDAISAASSKGANTITFTRADGTTFDVKIEIATAKPDILGSVRPVAKTEGMTQSVGVDEEGRLWTFPGGGGSASDLEVIDDGAGNVTVIYTDDGFVVTDDGNGSISIYAENFIVTDDGSGNITIALESGSGAGGTTYYPGNGIQIKDNVISVDAVDEAIAGNPKPITSNGVNVIYGNVEDELSSI